MTKYFEDIELVWDNKTNTADIQFENDDIKTGNPLTSAVIMSLFTDARADPDFKPTDGTTNRRGNWMDDFTPSPTGSKLWQFERAKISNRTATLKKGREEAANCLQWMLDEHVAASVDVATTSPRPTEMDIAITIKQPDGTSGFYQNYAYAWDAIDMQTAYFPTSAIFVPLQPSPTPTPVVIPPTGQPDVFTLDLSVLG